MRVDRIAAFAQAMVPGLAGEMIKTLGRVPPDRRQSVFEGLYNAWTERERSAACRLADELFSPPNPWSEEAFVVSAQLLQSAFFWAMESDSIWDRRLSAKSIGEVIGCNMALFIQAYQKDRLAHRFNDPIEIGDITLKEGAQE